MLYGGGDSYFTWHGHPGYLKCLRFAVKNLSCLLFFLFSSLFKYFFPLFFLDLFYHGLGLVSNIGLKFTIFFHLLQYFAKFSGGYIPRLAWPVKWYRLCCLTCFGQATWWHRVFFCFTVNSLEAFRVATVKRERTNPNPPKAGPTCSQTPLANAGIESPQWLILMLM